MWRRCPSPPSLRCASAHSLTMSAYFACPNRIERAASPTGTSVTSTKTYSVSNPSWLRIFDGPVKVRMVDSSTMGFVYRRWRAPTPGRAIRGPTGSREADVDGAPFPRFDHGADVFPANCGQEGVLGSSVMCHRTGRSHRGDRRNTNEHSSIPIAV